MPMSHEVSDGTRRPVACMTTISWHSVTTDSFLYVQTSWLPLLLLLKIAKDVRLLALGTGQEALYSATGLAIEGRDMLIIFSSDVY